MADPCRARPRRPDLRRGRGDECGVGLAGLDALEQFGRSVARLGRGDQDSGRLRRRRGSPGDGQARRRRQHHGVGGMRTRPSTTPEVGRRHRWRQGHPRCRACRRRLPVDQALLGVAQRARRWPPEGWRGRWSRPPRSGSPQDWTAGVVITAPPTPRSADSIPAPSTTSTVSSPTATSIQSIRGVCRCPHRPDTRGGEVYPGHDDGRPGGRPSLGTRRHRRVRSDQVWLRSPCHPCRRRRCGARPARGVGDDGLGGQEQRCDRRRVLQRGTGHLGGVDDAGRDQVLVVAGRRR